MVGINGLGVATVAPLQNAASARRDVGNDGLILRELAPGVTVDVIRAATEPPLQIHVPPMAMDV
jgi:acyl CoA:acetate/3-ketoacid CoA transferase beta subunit